MTPIRITGVNATPFYRPLYSGGMLVRLQSNPARDLFEAKLSDGRTKTITRPRFEMAVWGLMSRARKEPNP